VFTFNKRFHNSALDSFLPPNTVLGNDPVIIPTYRVHVPAVKYVQKWYFYLDYHVVVEKMKIYTDDFQMKKGVEGMFAKHQKHCFLVVYWKNKKNFTFLLNLHILFHLQVVRVNLHCFLNELYISDPKIPLHLSCSLLFLRLILLTKLKKLTC
jgi:hypothetical protein